MTEDLTAIERAMMWERMSGTRLSDAERQRILEGGEFIPPVCDVPTYWQQKGMSIRVANAFANGGIRDLDDLKNMTSKELLRLPNFGPTSLQEVQAVTGWPKEQTTDADMLRMASAFDLMPFNPHAPSGTLRELKVERRHVVDPEAWAIVSEGHVLGRDGYWEIEPKPSSRDDAFVAKCRWSSAREAIKFAQDHLAKYPTGYAPDAKEA